MNLETKTISEMPILTHEEREELLLTIKQEVTDRKDTGAGLGLFVSLESELPMGEQLIKGTLLALRDNPALAVAWAEDWGRVVVGIHPTKAGTVELLETGKTSKNFVVAESSTMFDPEVLVGHVGGGKNVILLNSKPVTIEGMAVEVVHLVDELVVMKAKQKLGDRLNNFQRAVEETIEEGVEILVCSEEEILALKKQIGSAMRVRLYGSMAIKSVPKVMGGVMAIDGAERIPVDISVPVGKEVRIAKETEKAVEGQVSFGMGVTLGKPLHVGHLMNLTLAEVGRAASGGREVRIFSNDTAPRLGKMVIKLAETKGLEIVEISRLLKDGLIPGEELVEAYRKREEIMSESLLDEALAEVRKGGLVAVLEKESKELLVRAGFECANIVRESTFVETVGRELVKVMGNKFGDSGFAMARTAKGLKILEKKGELTSTTKVAAFLVDAVDNLKGVCLVDNEMDSFAAMDLVKSMGGNVDQMAGVGVGIDGALGSGTKGNLPTIGEMVEMFGSDLKEIAIFLQLTSMLVAKERPNGRDTSTFFDFASSQAVIEGFGRAATELDQFKTRINNALIKLGTMVKAEILPSQTIKKALDDAQKELTTDALVNGMRKLVVVSEDQSVVAILDKWSQKWKGNLHKDLLHMIMAGEVKTNVDFIMHLRHIGMVPDFGALPAKTIPLKSNFLEAAMAAGFTGEKAVERAIKLHNKELVLLRRNNQFATRVHALLALIESATAVTKSESEQLTTLLLDNIARLGINI